MNDLEMILVHNHKGGTGKTMLAVHLAEYLADEGQEWCLWDADPQANAISWLTEHQWEGEDTIGLPASGARAALRATVLPDGAFGCEHIIVDTPPADSLIESLSQHVRLDQDDLVVCPVNGRLAIDGAIKVAEEVAPFGCRVVLVANLTDPRDGFAKEEIRALEELSGVDELNVEVFQLAIPRNAKYVREAELRGVPAWEIPYADQTYTVQAIKAFCRWIADGAPREANAFGTQRTPEAPTYAVSRKLKNRLWN